MPNFLYTSCYVHKQLNDNNTLIIKFCAMLERDNVERFEKISFFFLIHNLFGVGVVFGKKNQFLKNCWGEKVFNFFCVSRKFNEERIELDMEYYDYICRCRCFLIKDFSFFYSRVESKEKRKL